jgi:hypothetical protein
LTNKRGYLLSETGAIIENLNGEQMFAKSEIDERDELPGCFGIEKFNFNPH